jgi:anti-anti-sigma factor
VILHLTKANPKSGVAIVHLNGSVHCGPDCRRLEQETDLLISSKENFVVFDFSQVTHIDSAAIGTIVRCYAKLKDSGGFLRLSGCAGMIECSLKMAQLHKVLEIYPNNASAVPLIARQKKRAPPSAARIPLRANWRFVTLRPK